MKLEDFRAEWPPIEILHNEIVNCWQYDRDKYIKNLLDVADVLNQKKVPFLLAFGTLLGALRDGGPCSGDQDVDVMTTEEHEDKLCQLVRTDNLFQKKGFRIGRVSQHIVTVDRDKSYVDIYVFRPKPDNKQPGLVFCCWQYGIEEWRLKNPWKMNLHGREWLIPAQPESYLTQKYGDWRTPRFYHATN